MERNRRNGMSGKVKKVPNKVDNIYKGCTWVPDQVKELSRRFVGHVAVMRTTQKSSLLGFLICTRSSKIELFANNKISYLNRRAGWYKK